jgi:Lon protease-like protein
MRPKLLPLFPLQVVLLPDSTLPLHIFEDRYKEMIGEAIENNSEFGVVLANEKGIVNTGCTAIVQRVTQKYPDGRMDIVVVGRRRFEVLQLNDEKAYLRGSVEFFDDDDFAAPSAEATAKVVAGFEELRRLEGEPEEETEAGDTPLSFRVGRSLPDLNFRQTLLATRSESERIQRLAEYLPQELSRRRIAAEMRIVAPTNGHGKHLGL